MYPKELKEFLRIYLNNQEPLLIVGAPGVGKTQIVKEASEEVGREVIVMDASLLDPTDFAGFPFPDPDNKLRVVRRLDEVLYHLVSSEAPKTLFIDELGQASGSVQAALAPLILDKRVGNLPLKNTTIICATNRREDKAGVNNFLSHIPTRITRVTLEPNLDDWVQWGIQKIASEIIGFLRFRPAYFHKWGDKEIALSLRGEPNPNPRSWEGVSKILQFNMPKNLETTAIHGRVGMEAGVEFQVFLGHCRGMPDLKQLLEGQRSREFPWSEFNVSQRYAIATALPTFHKTHLALILEATNAAVNRGFSEFAVLAVKDILSINPGAVFSPQFAAFRDGELGKLVKEIS